VFCVVVMVICCILHSRIIEIVGMLILVYVVSYSGLLYMAVILEIVSMLLFCVNNQGILYYFCVPCDSYRCNVYSTD